MKFSGRLAGFVYVDELSNPRACPPIQPIDVACSACGAAPHERCNRGVDPRTGRVRQRGFHYRRKDDARLATEAVRALNPH